MAAFKNDLRSIFLSFRIACAWLTRESNSLSSARVPHFHRPKHEFCSAGLARAVLPQRADAGGLGKLCLECYDNAENVLIWVRVGFAVRAYHGCFFGEGRGR